MVEVGVGRGTAQQRGLRWRVGVLDLLKDIGERFGDIGGGDGSLGCLV